MRQLTASQKIAILENRVAQLEKQAIIEMIKNLGANWFKPLITASKELISTFKSLIAKKKSSFLEAAEMNLEARLNMALQRSMFFGKDPSIKILKFDDTNPIKSVIELSFSLNGESRVTNFTLGSIEKQREVDTKTQKDIMGAYVSWWNDWEDSMIYVKTGKMSEETKKGYLNNSKLKFLWRLLSAYGKFEYKINILAQVPNLVAGLLIMFGGPLLMIKSAPAVATSLGFISLAKVGDMILKMVEGVFRRRDVNMDKFNELAGKKASVNKYARKYPHTYSMLLRLESAGI